jgi:hypothetical protein
MRIGVCGIACEACPKRAKGKCPAGPDGCTPRDNKFCKICTCAFRKGVRYCFECPEFPCEATKDGPISYGYCRFLSGKE